MEFKICYPDANNFNKVLKLKSVDAWQAEYIELDKNIGYWIAEDPFENDGFEIFKNLIASFPIQKDNNHVENFDPNPFDTIHVPLWVSNRVCNLVEEFYYKHYKPEVFDPQLHEWGNVYFKERSCPITCWRIPHIDYVHGMVANMWFTSHPIEDSGTKIYRYNGNMKNDIYDFQIDESHPLHREWKSISDKPERAEKWFNLPEEELKKWGFDLLGIAPCKEKTVTLYESNIPHLAYISDNIQFRWSHAFAFSHELPPRTFRDIYR